jgi:hypothetical protein
MKGTAYHKAGHVVLKVALGYPLEYMRFSWYDREHPGGVVGPSARQIQNLSSTSDELYGIAGLSIISS